MLFKQAGEFIINKLLLELPANLTYHNAGHTADVYQAAEFIGRQEKIDSNDMKLLLTAAWYHDSGFLFCSSGHEEESCRIARETLPLFAYTPLQIEQICSIIMATRLPQNPQNHLGEILADADLDYLGRDDFFSINKNLFAEQLLLGTIADEAAWYHENIVFMENHHYFTKTAINLRASKKDANLHQIKFQINNLAK